MFHRRFFACLLGGTFLTSATWLHADVKMSPIFGDHMVLQQGMNLPVWGTADAGEKVTVAVDKTTGSTTAGADGKWSVKLAPLVSGATPVTVTVTGKNTLKFEDVLIGEVWVCSGQSNMEYGMGMRPNPQPEIDAANIPLLRLFVVTKTPSLTPQTEIKDIPGKPMIGHWVVCTPESIVKAGNWGGFTAVGYFFGRELQKTTGAPVGLIASCWGGTPAQAWTSPEALEKDPALKRYSDAYQAAIAAYPQAMADFPAKKAAYEAELAKWNKAVNPAFDQSLAAWKTAADQAKAAGTPAPPKPQPPVPQPKPPADPNGGPNLSTTLFNGMIEPLLPYGIKGVIWYQGESNSGEAELYRVLFPTMITDWRARWGEGDFPFLFVQLAGYGPGGTWPLLRESQLKTLSLPKTGMATAVDIGDPKNIHPGDKLNVGLRLALAAEHIAYGKDVVYSGPIYDTMKIEGSAIRLSFTHVGGGLVIGAPPTYGPGLTPPPTDKLVGFVIAGDDKKWVPAEAKIEGNDIIVSSPDVAKPVAVRYAWEALPTINFYNKEGLPASPFRTDDWEIAAPEKPMDKAPAPAPSPSPASPPATK